MKLTNIFKKKKEVPAEVMEKQAAVDGSKEFVEGLVSVKDIIAPSALEVDFDFVRIDNKYFRTCFVVNYPRFVGMNWLSSLINFDATLRVSMNIYPTEGKEILDDLRRKVAEMEAEISTDIQRGRIVNPATQAKLEDALNLQADLVKGQERFFQFGLYVTIEAPTKDELNRITKNLEASLGSLMIISKKATLQMEEGFLTTLPLCTDKLSITRNMDTTSLATTFPFVSSDLSDDKGIMYGINEHNGSLVIFDRFSMPNYNSVVFASAGAGKSYMIKLEAMRSLMFDTELIIIDPENEYRVMADAVGGQYIAFGYGEESKINPFDLSLTVEEGENALNDKVLTLHKMFKIMLGAMDPMEESVLDRAVMEAYKAKGITPDPETQSKEAPLIEDLYKSLIGMEDTQAKNLAARLEKYIKGSFAGIFNQKTTVNLKNKFVVFGIRNLEETLRPVAMHIILDYIWTIIKKELKKRILIVDEAWYLMQYDDSAAFLRGIVKRGRKYYLGVTTITQDVDDFLETPYGKEIVTNSSIQILLKQHSAALDKVGEVFYLSEGEKQLLLSAEKGEGIFFAGQNHVAIKVIASEEEHKLITSNPEEILKNKSQSPKPTPDSSIIEEEKEINSNNPAFAEATAGEQTPSIPNKSQIQNTNIQTETKEVVETKPTPTTVLPDVQVSVEEIKIQNPSPPSGDSPLDEREMKKEETIQPKVLYKTEVEGVEDDLQKRITEMEEREKVVLEEHKKKVEEEEKEKTRVAEEERKEKEKMMGGFGALPKYQELFKAPKLPPLPPTPTSSKISGSKPLFVSQTKEPIIPQPPQLQKKAKPQFADQSSITNNPASANATAGKQIPSIPDKPQIQNSKDQTETKKDDQLDYDKLFGNDSSDKGGII